MADTSKDKQHKGRGTPTQQKTTRRTPTQQVGSLERDERHSLSTKKQRDEHQSTKKQRDEHQQQLVVRTVIVGISIALLAIVIGILYDQVWVPAQALAQVNDTKLTRREYWQAYQDELARQIVQSLQLAAMFGDNQQFGSQFSGRSPVINQQAKTVQSDPIEYRIINQWQENQILMQGAVALGIQVSDDDVYQQMAQDLAMGFLPAPEEPASQTDVLTATDTLTEPHTTEGITTTGASQEMTSSVQMPTPLPTPTVQPTPTASEARSQVERIFDKAYELYEAELKETAELRKIQLKPEFSKEDLKQAMLDFYRQQVTTTKVQEHLVSEESFEMTTEPERVRARQIFLAVDTPVTATQELTATQEPDEQAYEKRKTEAEQVVKQLRRGQDFAVLASEKSEDPGSRAREGDVGFFDKDGTADMGGTYAKPFVDAAFALEQNEISDPVRSTFGWHIIQVTDVVTTTFDEQLRQSRTEAYDKWIEEQRSARTIVWLTEETPTPTPEPSPTTVSHPVAGPPLPTPTMVPTEAEDDMPELGETIEPMLIPTIHPETLEDTEVVTE